MDALRFLDEKQVRELANLQATPFYVYSRSELRRAAQEVNSFAKAMPYGCTPRYAVKANSHPEVISILDAEGLHFDASSGYEAEELIRLGIRPEKILLTSQQLPENLGQLLQTGVQFTATSLHQLEVAGKEAPGSDIGVRINPGMGDGMNNRLTTGGVSASFGIWHEKIPQLQELAARYKNKITRLHMHIGTGTDPKKWAQTVKACLDIVRQLPDVVTLDIGGGFKAAYMPGDPEADMEAVSQPIAILITDFAKSTGRKLHVEIEPGRFLVVHAGSIVSSVIDLTDTGSEGYKFIRTDTGMTEILRPSMYGAQHQLVVVPQKDRVKQYDDFVVVGHCCESGDCLTVAKDDPEQIEPRRLCVPQIGDYLVVEAAGAYCASMAAVGYNAFPKAAEIVID